MIGDNCQVYANLHRVYTQFKYFRSVRLKYDVGILYIHTRDWCDMFMEVEQLLCV